MDDLPPPIQVASDSSNIPNPIEPPAPKSLNMVKQAIKFIAKIKWTRVSAYIVGFVGVVGIIYSLPVTRNLIESYFPNSSPIFGREVSLQGFLRSSNTGLYTLVLPDQQAYTLHFKPSASFANVKKLNEVVVKGRLGWNAYVIEDAEVYPLNIVTADLSSEVLAKEDKSDSVISPPPISTSQAAPSLIPSPPPLARFASGDLPLYPNITWEISQKKTLIFTSGKRKIEQNGIYQESALVSVFPQDFINYYIEGLKTAGFEETLNSISPDGITITYAKDDLFLTFGIKNIYSRSGNKKTLSGYRAFLEHN